MLQPASAAQPAAADQPGPGLARAPARRETRPAQPGGRSRRRRYRSPTRPRRSTTTCCGRRSSLRASHSNSTHGSAIQSVPSASQAVPRAAARCARTPRQPRRRWARRKHDRGACDHRGQEHSDNKPYRSPPSRSPQAFRRSTAGPIPKPSPSPAIAETSGSQGQPNHAAATAIGARTSAESMRSASEPWVRRSARANRGPVTTLATAIIGDRLLRDRRARNPATASW